MNLDTNKTTRILALAKSHGIFTDCTLQMFNWFQEAVAGDSAELDIDEKVQQLNPIIDADTEMNSRLTREWTSFVGQLRSAYSAFGIDVVRQQGFDEKDRIRRLALNIAKSNFDRARTNAREHFVTQTEGTLAS